MDPFPYEIYYKPGLSAGGASGPVEFVTETGSLGGAQDIILNIVLEWAHIQEPLLTKIINRYNDHMIKGPDLSYGDAYDKELDSVRAAATGEPIPE